MAAFYQSILLSNFVINTSGNKLLLAALHSSRDKMKARWASLFALQVPLMLLSYSLVAYILGLTLLVMRPLWIDPWGASSLVSDLGISDVFVRDSVRATDWLSIDCDMLWLFCASICRYFRLRVPFYICPK